jgi:hypothetical protein
VDEKACLVYFRRLSGASSRYPAGGVVVLDRRGAELWRAEDRVAVFLRRCDESDHLLAHFAVYSGTRTHANGRQLLEANSGILLSSLWS